jgi:hypothetical protein
MANSPVCTIVTATRFAKGALSPSQQPEEFSMPLFFIIAIGAGAFTLGATAVDATSDVSAQRRAQALQVQQVQTQPIQQGQAYRTMAECQQAAAAQGLSASVCQQGS